MRRLKRRVKSEKRKRRVGGCWRMDETDVRTKGQRKYLHRVIDKAGNTVDFLLTAMRDRKAALRFLYKAVRQRGTPAKITIDQSDLPPFWWTRVTAYAAAASCSFCIGVM